MKRKITPLGVPLVAVAAVALGGAGTAPAAPGCGYNAQYTINKRHNVSCDTAKKVFKDYYNHPNWCTSHPASGGSKCTLKGHKKWKCPRPWNDQTGKCVKDSQTSFRYKLAY
jgi:hypothetical protein